MTGPGKAVFLDRDGVINRAVVRDGKPYPPDSVEQLEILPGVAEALQKLKSRGFKLIVTTNQPDVARGTQTCEHVRTIHAALKSALPLDEFMVCWHDDGDDCDCRKPKPGLLLRPMIQLGLKAADCFMVGDRWRDIEAGRRAACRTVFIDYGYREKQPDPPADNTVGSTREALDWILDQTQTREGEAEMKSISDLRIKIFADGADKAGMLEMHAKPYIKGFTTNPTLMRKAGISNYEAFAHDILAAIPDRPISFEVFSDEMAEMKPQALKIASWGPNVYVKIPVTNTKGVSSAPLIRELAREGVKLNVTAMCTLKQTLEVSAALAGGPPSVISIFAGRVADTGHDPVPLMSAAVEILRDHPNIELLWASPRELLNIFQADEIGCNIITVTNDILKKLALVGKDLTQYSLETVQLFYNDATSAGFKL